ncbi:GFA family protein [Spirochaeta lutea]|uniref:Aldehyde-activating protein n=1 Tax=Spirochaeta lutea TaxID=1480694 RepID=A0A098QT45_9SPIO|nr:GFA family protein [Spirochaeta lutea]KGE70854.1 aldehyde-activating protein [Spirochaeta lutea]
MKHQGSCLCGSITYEVTGEFEQFFLCHCASCRKDTGSAHAANLFSTKAHLEWLKGAERVITYNHNNSGHIKSFCPDCSSALPNLQMDGSLLVVPAGSLDTELEMIPTGHIYLQERATWDHNLEKSPQYDALPNEGTDES